LDDLFKKGPSELNRRTKELMPGHPGMSAKTFHHAEKIPRFSPPRKDMHLFPGEKPGSGSKGPAYVEDFAIEERPKRSKSRMRAQRIYLRTSP
jgi:hypothetical protein